jgi:outer membrane protein assembly factor BamB/Icc-related predicted phosphoesterase
MRLLITLISLFFITGDFLHSEGINSEKCGAVDSSVVSQSVNHPSGQQQVAFAFLTDLHVSPGSVSEVSLNHIIAEINRINVDFTVVTGDLSNSGSDAELNSVKSALDKLRKPCYVIPGNHETNWSESAGLKFNRLWGSDHFIFNLKGYQFVGFNTGPFMKMGDGYVKQEDIRWLDTQLKKRIADNNVLISFSHYPLSDGVDDWLPVTEVLKTFGCRIDFCGHGHRLALFNFNGIPGIMGRALQSGNSSPPGYNIVNLRNDSILIYEKVLSYDKGKPVIALNYLKPDTLSSLPISPVPDFSGNRLYTNTRVVFEYSDSASVFSGPCLAGDSILVYGNSMGWLKAISLRTQQILWSKQISGPVYSTPVCKDRIVVIGTIEGKVLGLDALDGHQLWEVNTGRPVLCEGITEGEFVYIGGGDSKFYKIGIKTGSVKWKFEGITGLIQGKPVISDSSIVFGAWDRHIYCLNKNTGSLRWKWDNGNPQVLYSPGNIIPVCSDNKVFIVAPDRYMTALDLCTGKEIWRTNRHQVRESIGISPDGMMVYAKLMNDSVIAVSASANSAETIWSVNAGFGYEHNPCPVLGLVNAVVNGTRDGVLVNIDPKTSKIIWKYRAGISSINKIVADKSKTLWFTMTEGKIIGIKTIDSQ